MSHDTTWHLSNIPRVAHFYWGAKKLSFLRFMSLYSFRHFNPDWIIKLHVPTQLNDSIGWEYKQYENQPRDFMDYMTWLPSSNVQVCPTDFNKLGLGNHLNEVHKSDFLRYYLLYQEGGVYSDMDVLFCNPMTALSVNTAQDARFDSFCYWGRHPGEIPGHAIGFLMGARENRFFRELFSAAKRYFRPDQYQTIGADLLNTRYSIDVMKRYSQTGFLDKQSVYAIDHNHREYLFEWNGLHYLGPNSVGMHWYGGSQYVSDLLFGVNHENYLSYNNEGTILQLLRKDFPDGIKQ